MIGFTIEMLGHLTSRWWFALAVFAAIFSGHPCLIGQTDTGGMSNTERMAVVTWSADLSGKREIPSVVTNATGKAGFVFDFSNHEVTVNLVTHDIQDVQRVELRLRRSAHDASGPILITVYEAKDGPFNATLTKTFSAKHFEELATVILNGRAIVTVSTKSHPDGEITGRVQMHKSYR